MEQDQADVPVHCCADCGSVAGVGVSLKACKSRKLVKYCNAECQKNHWPTHKQVCKLRAAELHDESLFKDPPVKEDCPICFLPMPMEFISALSLPPATVSSVPVYDLVRVRYLIRILSNTMNAAGRVFVEGAYTP